MPAHVPQAGAHRVHGGLGVPPPLREALRSGGLGARLERAVAPRRERAGSEHLDAVTSSVATYGYRLVLSPNGSEASAAENTSSSDEGEYVVPPRVQISRTGSTLTTCWALNGIDFKL